MISAQEVVRQVKSSGRPFAYGTLKGYNRRGLTPKKKSAATKEGKLIWLYPDRTVEIINRIIDEREMGANLDYIATFLWLDIALAEMSEKKLNLLKGYLGEHTIRDPDERGRVLGALTAGLVFLNELREAHVPEKKLSRLFCDIWRGISLLVQRSQGRISEEEFKKKFENPDPELDERTKEFAEEWFLLCRQEEAKEKAA